MYVLRKYHRAIQFPKSYGPGTTRMSPVTLAYISFVIDHLCPRIVSVRHRCCPGSIPVIDTWQSNDRLPKVIDILQVLQEFRAFEFFAIEVK